MFLQVSVRVRDSGDFSGMGIEDLLNHFRAETEAFH